SHGAISPDQRTGEGEALVDLVYGGRAQFRSLVDASPSFRGFAQASGFRLIAAGLTCLSQAASPRILRDQRSGSATALQSLFSDKLPGKVPALMQAEQETAFLVIIGVAIWAALVPWLAGAEATAAGMLSLLALMFPIIVMLTTPASPNKRAAGS